MLNGQQAMLVSSHVAVSRGHNTTGWNGAAPARGARSGKLAERQGQDHKREADDGSEKAFLEWAR